MIWKESLNRHEEKTKSCARQRKCNGTKLRKVKNKLELKELVKALIQNNDQIMNFKSTKCNIK